MSSNISTGYIDVMVSLCFKKAKKTSLFFPLKKPKDEKRRGVIYFYIMTCRNIVLVP